MRWRLFLPALAAFMLDSSPAAAEPRKLLLVTTTVGYRHSSIETAEQVISRLGQTSGAYRVELASATPPPEPGPTASAEQRAAFQGLQEVYRKNVADVLAAKLNAAALERYDAIVFANTTGELPLPDPQAFVDWIRDGGAFVGVHSASDTLHGMRPYIDMLGGEFDHHREQVRIEALNGDRTHPATRHLGERWNLGGRLEEIYLFKNVQSGAMHELLALDRHPNTGAPGRYPLAWSRDFGRGRVFYTALGHNEHVWEMPAFQQHLLGGILWALKLDSEPAPSAR